MSEDDTPRLTIPVGPNDHVQGSGEAPVTLLEYGDYECPYCGAAYPIVKEVQRKLGDQLRFVFRNFPLGNMHPHATLAAEAAEVMAAEGKFWEMHDMLYEHQSALNESDLVAYAGALGVDRQRFSTELRRPAFADRVRADVSSGIRSGVNGTPTFYINEFRHNGSYDLEELLAAIRSAGGEGRAASSPHSSRNRKRSGG
jgi:protein-disulfide isomerase